MTTVRITGLKELNAALKAIGRELPKEMTKLSKESAEIVAPEAQSLAPVLTGRLRGAVQAGATQKGGYVKVSTPYVGPIVGGWPKHHIKPNPFLWHALDNKTDDVIDHCQDGIADLITRLL